MSLKASILSLCLVCFSMQGFSGKIDQFSYEKVKTLDGIQNIHLKSVNEIQAYQKKILSDYQTRLSAFLQIPAKKRNLDNTLQQIDMINTGIIEGSQILHTMALVEPNDELREAYLKGSMELNQAFIDSLSEHRELYQIMSDFQTKMKKRKSFKKKHDYMLTQLLIDMKNQGMHLPEEANDRVKKIKKELLVLEESFTKNIREDNSSIAVQREELEGLPSHFIDQLKIDEDGKYHLTCDYPTYFTAMKFCESEKVRRNLYRAFHNRAYPENIEILHKVIQKRDHLAKELGYPSYAHFQLSSQMAKEPEKAQVFLDELISKSQKKEKDEAISLKRILNKNEQDLLEPWNGMYAKEKFRSKEYAFNENDVKEYFPLESTMAGLMEIYERFFDLDIKEEKVQNLWHEDVRLMKISKKGKSEPMGYILMDLFPRKSKYGHACSSTLYAGLEFEDQSSRPTINLLIMNFPKPTKGKPALMNMEQMRTFFHEFGHGIHAVLGRTEYGGTSGYNVKWDFVELPSQILEEWLKDKEILKMLSSHYETGEKIPDELVDKIIAARKMDSGGFVIRQCLLSNLSLECFLDGDDKDTIELYRTLHDKSGNSFEFDPKSHFQASFGHLQGYGAMYYGYLWSRVFALDVFSKIKEEGLLNPKAGERYIREIIGKGGSEDPEVLLRNYLQREPKLDAFLEAYGIY